MNNQVLIMKASVNYGASKSSTTAETATTPDTLRDGAIGLFYEGVSGWTLVTSAAPSTKNATSMPRLMIVQGTPTGKNTRMFELKSKDVTSYEGHSYVAPVKAVSYVGTDGTTGDGITVKNSATYGIRVIKKFDKKSGRHNIPKSITADTAASGATGYSIAASLADNANSVQANSGILALGLDTLFEVVSDGTRSAFANDATVTNGSTTVSVTGHGLSAGDFVKFEGSVYKIASTTTNAFELDRAYVGVDATIAASDGDSGSYASITKYGLRITADNNDESFEFALVGALEGAYLSEGMPTYGIGTSTKVAEDEAKSRFSYDLNHPGGMFPDTKEVYTVDGETYDVITIMVSSASWTNPKVEVPAAVKIAIPVSNSTQLTTIQTYLNAWANSMDFASVSL